RQLRCEAGMAFPCAFLAQGKRLLITHREPIYEEWDLSTGEQVKSWRGPDWYYPPRDSVSRDERWFLMSSANTQRAPVVLRNIQTGQESRALPSRAGYSIGAIAPNGEQIAVGDVFGRISILQIPTLDKVFEFPAFFQAADSVAFFPNGSRLAAGGTG